MRQERNPIGLEPSLRFDHFAYPVDDLVKAEDFYTRVLEIPFYERRGLHVRDVQAGTLGATSRFRGQTSILILLKKS